MNNNKTVYVIDDDEGARKGLVALLSEYEYEVVAFESAESFLQHIQKNEMPACIILDIKMPGMSGLELQERLIKDYLLTPIIFITGHGTISLRCSRSRPTIRYSLCEPS